MLWFVIKDKPLLLWSSTHRRRVRKFILPNWRTAAKTLRNRSHVTIKESRVLFAQPCWWLFPGGLVSPAAKNVQNITKFFFWQQSDILWSMVRRTTFCTWIAITLPGTSAKCRSRSSMLTSLRKMWNVEQQYLDKTVWHLKMLAEVYVYEILSHNAKNSLNDFLCFGVAT